MSKKARFDIFKRDGFTCQYCGRKPPEAMLELDHIIPISQGGTDDFANKITSCFECNRGKAGTPLGFSKTRGDLAEETTLLAEKESQLKEYSELKARIRKRQNSDINRFDQEFGLSLHGRESIRYFLQIFPIEQILDALTIARYNKRLQDPEATFKYMCGVLHNWRRQAGHGS